MCLEMDSRKWKILGFFIRHTEGGGPEARVTFVSCHTFFFFLKPSLNWEAENISEKTKNWFTETKMEPWVDTI